MNSITDSTRRLKARGDKATLSIVPEPSDSAVWAGAPLRDTLRLLALPAVFGLSMTLFRLEPGKLGLYGFALLFGVLLLVSLRKGPEAILATAIIYMPLSKMYVARLAPGINGTNALELLLIAVWIFTAIKNGRKLFSSMPFTKMITIWFVFSILSIFTAIYHIGFNHFRWNYIEPLRVFFDQFVVFFIFVNLIRDKNMARRMFIYMIFAALIAYLYGFKEWFGTRDLSNIEKSRLLGPIGQPNEYAAFIIYSMAPILAWGAYYFPRWKSLILAPFAFIALRVLLGTFSRAAYIALALEVLGVSFVKSKKFLVMVICAITTIYFFIPSLVPNSMTARIDQTYQDRPAGAKYDRSADERLLLWAAAIKMTEDSPFLGHGFDQFSSLAEDYVSAPTKATDNQNMFLYTSSNMGLPALISLLTIIIAFGVRGWKLYKTAQIDIDRVVGLGATTMVTGLMVVNMFGTHMTDTAVVGFFWIYLASMSHLLAKKSDATAASSRKKSITPRTRP